VLQTGQARLPFVVTVPTCQVPRPLRLCTYVCSYSVLFFSFFGGLVLPTALWHLYSAQFAFVFANEADLRFVALLMAAQK
jgi:hypothetical protein